MPTPYPSYSDPKGPSGWITQLKAYIDEQVAGIAATVVVSAATHTLDLTNSFKVVEYTNNGPVFVTVPLSSQVAFPVGTYIELHQYGAGQVTIQGASGVAVFPTTGLLDNFNRADVTNSLGSNWSAGLDPSVPNSAGILSGQAYVPSGFKSNWWNFSQYGPNCEVFATIAAFGTTGVNPYIQIGCRIQNPGLSNYTGYFARIYDVDIYSIRRDNGVDNVIANIGNIVAGEKLGIEAIGNTITYKKFSGGSWSNMNSMTDTTYPGGGYVGIIFGSGVEARVDDFSGGTVVGAATVNIRSPGDRYKLTQQYASAVLRYRGNDEWMLEGDITV